MRTLKVIAGSGTAEKDTVLVRPGSCLSLYCRIQLKSTPLTDTVLMKHALRGPNVSLTDVLRAVAGAYASIELIASNRSGSSLQTRIIDGKFSWAYVLGRKLVALDGVDLRLEGMVAYRSGVAMGSATGAEVMSDPLNAVGFVANNLAEVGLQFEPGMLVMTGSLLANIPGAPGERYAMDFTRLGSVSAKLV